MTSSRARTNGRVTAPKPKHERKLRVVKLIVQPVLVLDDGEQLVEVSTSPMEVRGADWPTWKLDAFTAAHLSKLLLQLDEQPAEAG